MMSAFKLSSTCATTASATVYQKWFSKRVNDPWRIQCTYLDDNGWWNTMAEQFVHLRTDIHDPLWGLLSYDHVCDLAAISFPVRLCDRERAAQVWSTKGPTSCLDRRSKEIWRRQGHTTASSAPRKRGWPCACCHSRP